MIGQLSSLVREGARRIERGTQRLEALEVQPFVDEVKGNIILVTVLRESGEKQNDDEKMKSNENFLCRTSSEQETRTPSSSSFAFS